MSEAIKGTAYNPTLTPGLQASVDRDLLPAWRKAKDEAYQRGMKIGEELAAGIVGVENLAAKALDTPGKNR